MAPPTRSNQDSLSSWTFDLARARRDTPGCEQVLHFNNAGAGLMPRPVLDATIGHLTLEARIGAYEAADQAHDAVERVYAVPLGPGDRVLTARAE
ncbi:MAG: hypothetical protein ACRELA_17310 [Candidatus Rokuibacteriota bacterium]